MENNLEIKNQIEERINTINDELKDSPSSSLYFINKEDLRSLSWYNKELKSARFSYKYGGIVAIIAVVYLLVMSVGSFFHWFPSPQLNPIRTFPMVLLLVVWVRNVYLLKLKTEKLKTAIFLFELNSKIST